MHASVRTRFYGIVHGCPAPGLTICFDYITVEIESVLAGEPFRFWIAPDKIGAFLAERGLAVKDHLDCNEMEKRYLTLKDESYGKICSGEGGKVNKSIFEELDKIYECPAPFEFYTAADLWTDEHTSRQMLKFHLAGKPYDPHRDEMAVAAEATE